MDARQVHRLCGSRPSHRLSHTLPTEDIRAKASRIPPQICNSSWTRDRKLEVWPGIRECIPKLQGGAFALCTLTAADRSSYAAYFGHAGNEFPYYDNLLSCDTSSTGKPEPASYNFPLDRLWCRYTTSAMVRCCISWVCSMQLRHRASLIAT